MGYLMKKISFYDIILSCIRKKGYKKKEWL